MDPEQNLNRLKVELPRPYQIMRNTSTMHCINGNLSMEIKTFVRLEHGTSRDDSITIIFRDKSISDKDFVEIKSGDTFELLKAKYFKPEMVSY